MPLSKWCRSIFFVGPTNSVAIFPFKSIIKVLLIWTLSLLIVGIDVYIEKFIGSNILGYGGGYYGNRIVSFFKDEPIIGGYINAFYLLIIGYHLFLQ